MSVFQIRNLNSVVSTCGPPNHGQPCLALYKQVGPVGRPAEAADGEIESDTSYAQCTVYSVH